MSFVYFLIFKTIFLDCECVLHCLPLPCIECVQTNEVPLTNLNHMDVPGDGEGLTAVQTLVVVCDGGKYVCLYAAKELTNKQIAWVSIL